MTHTTDSPAVSVIVPVYNEEENVPILQAELRAALKAIDHEVILVDDGSADHTVERIEAAPNLRVIRFEKNAGQSAAMYAGLQAARGAILVLIDGDLQNDPADIPKLLGRNFTRRGSRLRLSRAAQGHACEAAHQPDCERRSQPVHERRRARHRLYAQSNAARVRQCAGSIQGDASLHSCSDKKRQGTGSWKFR